MPTAWPRIRSTSCCWTATRFDGARLASQPTISRFEQAASPRTLYGLGEALADTVIGRHARRKRKARLITIDVDVTADPTHGAQHLLQWVLRHVVLLAAGGDAHLRQGIAPVSGRGDPAAGQRPGHGRRPRPAAAIDPATLARVSPRPPAGALDGGFAAPEIFDELEAGVEYVVAMAKNTVLAVAAEPHLIPLRPDVAATQATATSYHDTRYQAGTWAAPRRVVIKAEVVWHHGREARDNPRFVITNLRQTPEWIYTHVYCARGDSENRLKELHHALAFGRTSCTRFWANQLRVTLTAAYVLLQELQLRADHTALAGAQVARLRHAVLTIGVHVVRSVRRIVLHFPQSHPEAGIWIHVARDLAAART